MLGKGGKPPGDLYAARRLWPHTMRILLIAPESPGISAIPEIRAITSKHHAMVLNGMVTPQIVSDYAQRGYNAIYFAGHSTPEYVELSNGEQLKAEDIARIARDAHAGLIIFNSCLAAKLAAYAVAHGVSYAIAATIELKERDAWKFPSSFFLALANGAWRDILNAFQQADSGEGEYSLTISPVVYRDVAQQVVELQAKFKDTVVLNPRALLFVFMLSLLSLFVVGLLLIGLSGIGVF